MLLTKIYCEIDDFCKNFEPLWNKNLIYSKKSKRVRKSRLSMSEIMTIIVYFHHSKYRTFKDYYLKDVSTHLKSAFPDLVSYNRFVELMKSVLIPLIVYLNTHCTGECTGIAFIDSTSLKVCNNKRINNHKVFKGIAERGKTSMGWFYGFKLHLVINDKGEILSFAFSKGNVDDRDRTVIYSLIKNLFGKLFGDKGYISKDLFSELMDKGIHLITKLKKNMKNKLMPMINKILLRKRGLIETVNDELKNICQIEHTRHRSPSNFLVNLFSGLIAYSYLEKKPSLKLNSDIDNQLALLAF